MKEQSLREVEIKTYASYHQDGLIDIFLGVYVLLFGLGIALKTMSDLNTWFVIPAIFPAIMVPVWLSAKKRITIPRIGYVKFRSRGTNRLMAVFLGLMVFGLGTFMVFSLASSQSWTLALRDMIISNGMLIIGVLGAAISSLFAYTMGLKRLYAYGVLTLVLFFTGHFIVFPFEYFLIIIGLVIFVNGFVLLVRFIRKHPIAQGDKSIGEESS